MRTHSIGILPLTWSLAFLAVAITPAAALAQTEAIGDTLTVIQRPLLNMPVLVTPGQSFVISCAAEPATTGWAAELRHGQRQVPLTILTAGFDPATLWWSLTAQVSDTPLDLLDLIYDLHVSAGGGIDDVTRNAVRIIPAVKTDWYFVHLTDPHLPDHAFSDQGGAVTDSTEMEDLRAVIQDINLINPEFVLLTGDLVNEGELEDHLGWRQYTRAQRLLTELEVPVYLTAGNHDIGGWDSTPPPDGTARREWWRFFGWRRLDSPPPGAPEYTQNYSFDYGPVHFVGLESYINYDDWRQSIYGTESFTSGQLAWLAADLSAASGSAARVLFYHRDFSNQIYLSTLNVEMALSGHIHRDEGNLSNPPFDLTTNNVCDQERAYRLIRVSGAALQPRPTLAAGASGQNLRVYWTPANDGTHDSVTAQIVNNHNEGFEHARLQFLMPSGTTNVQVTNGTFQQVDDSGAIPVFYVAVDILPNTSQTVTVTVDSATDIEDHPVVEVVGIGTWLGTNHPNPFNPATFIEYSLGTSSPMSLAIFDAAGRLVRVLAEGWREAGRYTVFWDGRNDRGDSLPSGVYFCRLTAGGDHQTRPMMLVR